MSDNKIGIILTSAGIKQEGKKYSRWFDSPEQAWITYNKLLARYFKKNSSEITFIQQPHIITSDIHRFNSGDPIIVKRYNIYSRFRLNDCVK